MLHGNIYPPEKIPRPSRASSVTRTWSRCASWRFVSLPTRPRRNCSDYLVARHPAIVWDTAERIMVVVTAAPGTDAVLRRAARIAVGRTPGCTPST